MAGGQGVRAGRAFVEILAEDSALRRGLAKAQRHLQAFASSANAIGNKLAIAGGAVTGSLFAAFQHFATAGDELSKMSDRTGVAVETLSLLKFAAEQSDASFQALGSGIQALNKGLLKAEDGSGNVAEALAELGLSAQGISKLPADEKFMVIADRLAGVEDVGRRAALSMALFRGAGEELLPLINEGAAGIRTLMDEAERRGLKVSSEDARTATLAGDSMASAWAGIKRAVFSVGAAIAPIVADIAEHVSALAAIMSRWIEQNRELVTIALYTGAALLGVGIGLKIVGAAASATAILLKGVNIALAVTKFAIMALSNPIVLIGAGVVGLGAVLLTQTSLGRDALNWLGDTFHETMETGKEAWSGISAALAKGDIGGAMRVAMLGLQVEFTRGVNFLKKLWIEVWSGIKIFAINTGYAVAKGLTSAWSGIQQGWNWLTSTLSQGWTAFTFLVQNAWARASGFLQKSWNRIKGIFNKSFDAKTANAAIDEQTTKALDGIKARAKAELDAKRKAQQEQADRIERERKGTVDVLQGDQDKALKQVVDQADQQIADLEKQLSEAKRAFQGAVAEAKKPAAGDPKKPGEKDPFQLPQLTAAGRKIETVGTFSASAAARMGTLPNQRIPKQQLDALKAIEKLSAETKNLIRQAGLFFGA